MLLKSPIHLFGREFTPRPLLVIGGGLLLVLLGLALISAQSRPDTNEPVLVGVPTNDDNPSQPATTPEPTQPPAEAPTNDASPAQPTPESDAPPVETPTSNAIPSQPTPEPPVTEAPISDIEVTIPPESPNATPSQPCVAVGSAHYWLSQEGAATEIEVVMTPTQGDAGYHYYSLQSSLIENSESQHSEGGLYAGIQTNGSYNGQRIGKAFIFSVWDARMAYPEPGVISTPFSGEGVGYSLRMPYDWQVGRSYGVAIRRGAFDAEAQAYRWQAGITDQTNGQTLNLGTILAPQGRNLLSNSVLFHERYAGDPICCASSPTPEKAGVVFNDLHIKLDGEDGLSQKVEFKDTSANGIFAEAGCQDFLTSNLSSSQAESGFGVY